MKFAWVYGVAAGLLPVVSAISVSGAAEGFAKGVTGGGSATAVYPTTTDELVSYLGDSSPRVIVLDRTLVLYPGNTQLLDLIKTGLTSLVPKAPLQPLGVHRGELLRAVSLPLTRMTGALTISRMRPRCPSHSTY